MTNSSDLRVPYHARIFVFIPYAMKDFEQKSSLTRFETITLDSAGNISDLGEKFESRS